MPAPGRRVRHDKDLISAPDGLALPPEVSLKVAGNILGQLAEQSLIRFKEVGAHPGHRYGVASIKSYGVDVIEATRRPAIAITLDQSINVHRSSNVQIGKGNIQNASLDKVAVAIDQAEATQTEKAGAKSLLEKLTNNKLLLGVLAHFGLVTG